MTGEVMSQIAPYPHELAELVAQLAYRPGWRFHLEDIERDPATTHSGSARGLTLVIFADVHDSYHPEQRRPVNHYFIVPAATYDRRAWLRWLLDRVLDVEQHEACEWFRLSVEAGAEHMSWVDNDTPVRCQCLHGADHYDTATPPAEKVVRPYAPNHGPGRDPYTIAEYATDLDRRTSFRGVVAANPPLPGQEGLPPLSDYDDAPSTAST